MRVMSFDPITHIEDLASSEESVGHWYVRMGRRRPSSRSRRTEGGSGAGPNKHFRPLMVTYRRKGIHPPFFVLEGYT